MSATSIKPFGLRIDHLENMIGKIDNSRTVVEQRGNTVGTIGTLKILSNHNALSDPQNNPSIPADKVNQILNAFPGNDQYETARKCIEQFKGLINARSLNHPDNVWGIIGDYC